MPPAQGWFQYFPGWLVRADQQWMRRINVGLYQPWLAWMVSWLANDVFLVLLLLVWLAWIWKRPRQEQPLAKHTFLVCLILVISVHLSLSWLVKPLFARPRPWQELAGLHLMFHYYPRSFSFPSTHTAMAVAAGGLFGARFKRTRVIFGLLATAVAFFCVYSGGHYPLDVMAGGLVGFLAALLALFLDRKAPLPEDRVV